MLRPIFATNDDGLPLYPTVFIEMGRGSWKTGAVAAVAMAEALLFPSTEVVCVAADVEQGQIILDNIKGYLARNEDLRASFKQTKEVFNVPGNGSRIRVLSSDLASAYGLFGTHARTRLVLEELAVWPDRGQELFGALYSATGKVPNAQTLILSNAGFDAERSWQYSVRADAEREGWLYSPEGVIASWLSPAWIERMQRT